MKFTDKAKPIAKNSLSGPSTLDCGAESSQFPPVFPPRRQTKVLGAARSTDSNRWPIECHPHPGHPRHPPSTPGSVIRDEVHWSRCEPLEFATKFPAKVRVMLGIVQRARQSSPLSANDTANSDRRLHPLRDLPGIIKQTNKSKSINQQIGHFIVNKSININQPTNQSNNQSNNRSIEQSINQSIKHSINRSINQPTNQSNNQSIKQSNTQSIN